MKRTFLMTPLMAGIVGISAGRIGAADYKNNPFTLVYDGAITKNEPGKVNIHPVTYKLNGRDIAANVYTPANYDRRRCGTKSASTAESVINDLTGFHVSPVYKRKRR